MKYLLLITTFMFTSFSAWAQAYHLYDAQEEIKTLLKKVKDKDHKAKLYKTLTAKEKEIATELGINPEILTIETRLSLKELKQLLPNQKIEALDYINLNSNYSNEQWSLNNQGGNRTRWISDIDTEVIAAKTGEDINLGNTLENNKLVKIAVIDSGIDINHPDLKNKIRKSPLECKELEVYSKCLENNQDKEQCHQKHANKDLDGNGYPLDCNGWNLTGKSYPGVEMSGNPEVKDGQGHGTHVAGIIGAEKNKKGIDGILTHVEIIPVKIASVSGSQDSIDNIAKGVIYAIKAKANIINLSLGWRYQNDSTLMRQAVKAAMDRGILVVVAAGNDSHSDISYPCAYQNVICVGAHNEAGVLSKYSNSGTQVDILAPGDSILSTWPLDKRSRKFTQDYNYELMSGTSQATPIVSAVLGRLLNLGFTPEQAKIKLLRGARNKTRDSLIKHGNLDFQNALKASSESFIYPQNKEAYLIKWDHNLNNKFRLKLKNHGTKPVNLKVTLQSRNPKIKLREPNVNIAFDNSNEVFTDIPFNILEPISDSEIHFDLKIKSNTEEKTYPIKAQFIRVIHPEITGKDITPLEVIDALPENLNLKAFDNIGFSSTLDFFAVRVKNNKYFISILKEMDDGKYTVSRELPIREANPTFLNFSKVDLDQDGNKDYFISFVYINKDGDKITKFISFKNDLSPRREFISPKNEFDNGKTFMPGKFKWVKHAGKMVPAWIGHGERATEIIQSPWEPAVQSEGNFLYYLTEKGLQNFELKEKETILHGLYQTDKQKEEGVFHFISSKNFGFHKSYKLYQFNESIIDMNEIKVDSFFDLFNSRPIQFKSNSPNAFFNEAAIEGGQHVFKTELHNGSLKSSLTTIQAPSKGEAIHFVNQIHDNLVYFQTASKIYAKDLESGFISGVESKVNIKRRRYKAFKNTQGLYLPASESPGMTSEVLQVNNTGRLIRNGRLRSLAIKGCKEMGIVQKHHVDFVAFNCTKNQKIILLKVNK